MSKLKVTPDDEVLGVKLPKDWDVTWFAGGRHAHITWRGNGCVSIDTEYRKIRGGMTTIGRSINETKYTGRGWKQQIVADAIAWLRFVFEERTP